MIIFERKKQHHDQTIRCYLTLDCHANCSFCSAGIPSISPERKGHTLPSHVWVEGINRRSRHAILAGGEPFLYDELPELVNQIDPNIKLEIYSNIEQPVDRYLHIVDRRLVFLVSLHPSVTDLNEWAFRIDELVGAGNGIRFHVVKAGDWQDRVEFLKDRFDNRYSITACDDQRAYPKSAGVETNQLYPLVECTTSIYSFGPLGYRYKCTTLLGAGGDEGRYEHISEPDSEDEMTLDRCTQYGLCVGCDNLIESVVKSTEREANGA